MLSRLGYLPDLGLGRGRELDHWLGVWWWRVMVLVR